MEAYSKAHVNFRTDLSILLMYFESVNGDIEKARDLAKKMLQADSVNIKLWHAYANSEAMHKNIKEARRVYAKALSLCPNLPEKGTFHSFT